MKVFFRTALILYCITSIAVMLWYWTANSPALPAACTNLVIALLCLWVGAFAFRPSTPADAK